MLTYLNDLNVLTYLNDLNDLNDLTYLTYLLLTFQKLIHPLKVLVQNQNKSRKDLTSHLIANGINQKL